MGTAEWISWSRSGPHGREGGTRRVTPAGRMGSRLSGSVASLRKIVTYTLFVHGGIGEDPFSAPAIEEIARDWLTRPLT